MGVVAEVEEAVAAEEEVAAAAVVAAAEVVAVVAAAVAEVATDRDFWQNIFILNLLQIIANYVFI